MHKEKIIHFSSSSNYNFQQNQIDFYQCDKFHTVLILETQLSGIIKSREFLSA